MRRAIGDGPAATLREREDTNQGLGPLIYLGRISYGLYVFHVLGLFISDHLVANQTASLARYALRIGVAFAITVAMAAASYRWLETPFLSLKRRFTHVLSRPGG